MPSGLPCMEALLSLGGKGGLGERQWGAKALPGRTTLLRTVARPTGLSQITPSWSRLPALHFNLGEWTDFPLVNPK